MSRKVFIRTLAGFMFILFLISLPSLSFAQEGKWTTKADIPTPRFALSSSTVDGKIYAVSGRMQNTGRFSEVVEEYDPATDTWTRKADIPTVRSEFSTSVVDGKIYAIGGWTNNNSHPVEVYDPATDTWTKKADMPIPHWWSATSAVDGKIYAIGGTGGISMGLTEPTIMIVMEYNPATETWVSKADMPTARSLLSASAVNGKIYAIGGRDTQETILSTVEEYDPLTDTWTKKADMPVPTFDHNASVVNGKIYVMGGGQRNGTIFSTIMKYDPATDIWTIEGDMTTPRTAMSEGVVDGSIYVIGGTEVGVRGISTVEAYKPEPWGFASDPNPANGATHSETWVNLSWNPGDLAVSHDVYLGDNFDDVNDGIGNTFRGNTDIVFFVAGFPGYAYPDGLVPGTTYYWRVDEVNDSHPESPWKGPVWSFFVPPRKAYEPVPADGAESVGLDVELSWMTGFGAVVHTVYFGDDFEEVNNATNGIQQAATTYTPGPLEFAKTYYWRVDELADVQSGQIYKGDIWSFSTMDVVRGNPDP